MAQYEEVRALTTEDPGTGEQLLTPRGADRAGARCDAPRRPGSWTPGVCLVATTALALAAVAAAMVALLATQDGGRAARAGGVAPLDRQAVGGKFEVAARAYAGDAPTTTTPAVEVKCPKGGAPIRVQVLIASGADDGEEAVRPPLLPYEPTLTLGTVSDFGRLYMGLRFEDVDLPKGSVIESAKVLLRAAAPGLGALKVPIKLQRTANAESLLAGSLSQRFRFQSTTKVVTWEPEQDAKDETLTSKLDYKLKGIVRETPNLKELVQEVVNLPEWQSGNAITVLFAPGSKGSREYVSFDGDGNMSPRLVVTFTAPSGVRYTAMRAVVAEEGDAVEAAASVNLASPDLEFGNDGADAVFGPQLVALRFAGVQVPQAAQVLAAKVKFSTYNVGDCCDKDVRVTAKMQKSGDAPKLPSEEENYLSTIFWKGSTRAAVTYSPEVDLIPSSDRDTPNLKDLVQEVISQSQWKAGNAMVVLFGEASRGDNDEDDDDDDDDKDRKGVKNLLRLGNFLGQPKVQVRLGRSLQSAASSQAKVKDTRELSFVDPNTPERIMARRVRQYISFDGANRTGEDASRIPTLEVSYCRADGTGGNPVTDTTTSPPTSTTNEWPFDIMTCPTTPVLTTACMTSEDYDNIMAEVTATLNGLGSDCTATSCKQADWAGCVLRMAGHDFMDFDSGAGGSDGCTDMKHPDNAGLKACLRTGEFGVSIWDVYKKFCGRISLADFLVLAAEGVMTFGRNLELKEHPNRATVAFKQNFRFGRTTAKSCPKANGILPNPEHGCNAVGRVFVKNMGLSWRLAAALMGVHNMGRAAPENSGYDGWWNDVEHARRFSNQYYIAMTLRGWVPEKVGPNKHQWQRSDKGADGGVPGVSPTRAPDSTGRRLAEDVPRHQIMLNTDMCLLYTNGLNTEELGEPVLSKRDQCCAWVESEYFVDAIRLNNYEYCGATRVEKADHEDSERALCCGNAKAQDCGDFHVGSGPAKDAVRLYANSEPAWLEDFQEAWTLATENGFTKLKSLEKTCRA